MKPNNYILAYAIFAAAIFAAAPSAHGAENQRHARFARGHHHR